MGNATSNLKGKPEITTGRWSKDSQHVKKAMQFIQKKGGVISPQELVGWDFKHGQKLFTWDNAMAGVAYRLHEARMFLNTWKWVKGQCKFRAFINIKNENGSGENNEEGSGRAYHSSADVITHDEDMRSKVISDIKKRIKNLMAQLKFWNLTEDERDEMIQEWREYLAE